MGEEHIKLVPRVELAVAFSSVSCTTKIWAAGAAPRTRERSASRTQRYREHRGCPGVVSHQPKSFNRGAARGQVLARHEQWAANPTPDARSLSTQRAAGLAALTVAIPALPSCLLPALDDAESENLCQTQQQLSDTAQVKP